MSFFQYVLHVDIFSSADLFLIEHIFCHRDYATAVANIHCPFSQGAFGLMGSTNEGDKYSRRGTIHSNGHTE